MKTQISQGQKKNAMEYFSPLVCSFGFQDRAMASSSSMLRLPSPQDCISSWGQLPLVAGFLLWAMHATVQLCPL